MRILVLGNYAMGLYRFRKELLVELVRKGYEVHIALPEDPYANHLRDLGCVVHPIELMRRGKDPLADLKLFMGYLRLLRKLRPERVLTYTIKPNIYGGLASRLTGTPYIANITGLGTALEGSGLFRKLLLFLYGAALKKAQCVFFQNSWNREFFLGKGLIAGRSRLVPGSGVNLEEHPVTPYPEEREVIRILFVGRIMRDKGIEELLDAAVILRNSGRPVLFQILGFCEEEYEDRLRAMEKAGIIRYLGRQEDVRPFMADAHGVILPSYHEGQSNVLLEAGAMGRPILATNVPGCREAFDEWVSGLGFEARSVSSLVGAVEAFLELPQERHVEMGLAGRRKMELEFDRRLVIEAYMEELER